MKTQSTYHPVLLSAVALNAAVLAAGMILFSLGGEHFTVFTREDQFVEWMQFLVFVAMAAMLAYAACDKWNRPDRKLLPVLGLGAFSALFFFAAGEEVSWFQRVLDVRSPDFFLKHNKQAETNLHNLVVGSVSVNKHIIVKLVAIAGLTHNVILPLLARRRPAIRERIEQWGFYLPPVWFSVITFALIALGQLLLKHPRTGEVTELIGAIHYFSTATAAYLFGVWYGDPALRTSASKTRAWRLYLAALGLSVLLAWLLAQG